MEILVASLKFENPVNFPFVGVIDHRRLLLRWPLAGGTTCIAVEQTEVEKVVLPDCIWKV
jgi:hypothetical protein